MHTTKVRTKDRIFGNGLQEYWQRDRLEIKQELGNEAPTINHEQMPEMDNDLSKIKDEYDFNLYSVDSAFYPSYSTKKYSPQITHEEAVELLDNTIGI